MPDEKLRIVGGKYLGWFVIPTDKLSEWHTWYDSQEDTLPDWVKRISDPSVITFPSFEYA